MGVRGSISVASVALLTPTPSLSWGRVGVGGPRKIRRTKRLPLLRRIRSGCNVSNFRATY
jgi:hypothetical protein